MPFFSKASISASIADRHSCEARAFVTVLGISSPYSAVANAVAVFVKLPLTKLAIGYLLDPGSCSGTYLFGGTPLVLYGGSMYRGGGVSISPSVSISPDAATLTSFWLVELDGEVSRILTSGISVEVDQEGVFLLSDLGCPSSSRSLGRSLV